MWRDTTPPLYLSVEEAAEYAGLGRDYMYDLTRSVNPPPHKKVGNGTKIQKATLAAYLESIQEVRYEP